MCNDEQEASYRKGEQGTFHISTVTVYVLENFSCRLLSSENLLLLP